MMRYIFLFLLVFLIGFFIVYCGLILLQIMYLGYIDFNESLFNKSISCAIFLTVLRGIGIMCGFVNGKDGKKNYEEFLEELSKSLDKFKEMIFSLISRGNKL